MATLRHPNPLLADALNAYERETGLAITLTKGPHHANGLEVDGQITLPYGAGTFPVEVKKWAQNANLGAITHHLAQLPGEAILIADYVNPNMAQKLRALGVQFIDAAGNAFINHPPLHTWVTANKAHRGTTPTTKTNRAFDATGLKVVFTLLCQPDLANQPYRDIAARAGVALGTVGQVFDGLKMAHFLAGQGRQGKRRLINRKTLLRRWVEAYPEKLKPKLLVGEFVAPKHQWWKDFDIVQHGAWWGGEIAAEKYTHYLQPKVATIYLPESAGTRLLADARLRKQTNTEAEPENPVEIYRPFWPMDYAPDTQPGLAHPILVYADLIHTGDVRNRETAGKLYEQYIAGHLGED